MRSFLVASSCGLALLLSATAMAGESQGGAEQAHLVPASQQLICRAPVHEGELLPSAKQCYTQQEWDARQKRMQNSIREMQMRALTQHR